MSTESLYLKNLLQILDENPDTWGTVLNVSAIQTLEDAIAGTGTVDVTSADQTLTDTAGGPSDLGSSPAPNQRFMIINITGAPGVARDVNVAPRSKVYLVINNTTGGQTITFKTAAGTGVTIPVSNAYWVYCDGTDIVAATVSNAATADLATNAVDSQLLDGLDSTDFGRLAVADNWSAGQVVDRVAVTLSAGDVDIDCALSNDFYHLTTGALNLTAPTNASNGQQFSLIIEQGTGAPHAMTFQATTFMFAGGVAPTLSTTLGQIDYLAFEYVTGLDDLGGARWIGSIIKDVSTV